jgi:hypothetical protein
MMWARKSISLARLLREAAVGVVVVIGLAGCGTNGTVDTSTPSPTPLSTPSRTPSPSPVVTTEIVTETETVPFDRVRRDDPSVDVGAEVVTTEGVDGVKTLTYEVVITDGVETSRTLVSEEITSAAVDEVTSVGTREPPPPPPDESQPDCDPNYSGACVPIDSDVDCAGGSGNGPSYVRGPVTVVGNDIYDLDRDGDGIGCDT